MKYVMETGLYEFLTGDRDLCGTYWRQGIWMYVFEIGLCEVRPEEGAL